jgi:hypothetical protein
VHWPHADRYRLCMASLIACVRTFFSVCAVCAVCGTAAPAGRLRATISEHRGAAPPLVVSHTGLSPTARRTEYADRSVLGLHDEPQPGEWHHKAFACAERRGDPWLSEGCHVAQRALAVLPGSFCWLGRAARGKAPRQPRRGGSLRRGACQHINPPRTHCTVDRTGRSAPPEPAGCWLVALLHAIFAPKPTRRQAP